MVSIREEYTESSPLSPSNIRRYNPTSTYPTRTAQLPTPNSIPQSPLQLGNFDIDPVAGTSKLKSDVADEDLVKSGNQKKKKRMSVGDRLKKLGKELGRFGKDKEHAASTSMLTLVASGSRQMAESSSGSSRTSKLNSPRSAGVISPSPSSSTSPPAPDQHQTTNNHLNMVSEAISDDSINHTAVQLREGLIRTHEPSDPEIEATTLTREIQHLVDSLPLPHPQTSSSPTFTHDPTLPASPVLSQQNFPLSPYPPEIPLPTASPTEDSPQPQIKDSRLMSLLSNASFMNGSSLKGLPSIWSILENTQRASPPNPNPASPQLNTTTRLTHDNLETRPLKEDELPPFLSPRPASSSIYENQMLNESSPSMVFSDTSSIMVYSPLFPTQSDIVELAELVPFDADPGEREMVEGQDGVVNSDMGGGVGGTGFESEVVSSKENVIGNGGSNAQEVMGGGTSWTLIWPFSIWYSRDQTHRSGLGKSKISSSTGSGGPERQSAESMTSPQVGTSNNVDIGSPSPTNQRIRPVKSQKSMRAWVPSSSKISVQAFWWGYRL